ncbi:unnamed protein product [Cylindrotheca closterium]|uniref:Major facilitator superfamily (MFS) profile domain-containing protein n=1 Tax=Cylindrotheca closterium TaxID=2856 RepID=A0AAD2G5Z1_9STRA|nr:unnamed protein product [Cylindrotheca closterium]
MNFESYVASIYFKIRNGFSSLKGSPPELYIAFWLKFLDSYSYFSFSMIFTLFLSSDFGFSDVQAGTFYGLWGGMITIFGLITGVVVDNIGVAHSLRIGFLISLIARIGIFWTTSKSILLFHLLVTMPLGDCLGIPVLATAIRRYTKSSSQGFAFGLFYVIMNVAALLSGPAVDILTIGYRGEGDADANANANANANGGDGYQNDYDGNDITWSLSSYRAIILTGIISNVLACILTLRVREIKVEQQGNSSPIDNSNVVSSFQPVGGTLKQVLYETIHAPSFRRFLVVCLITLNVRMIFRHLDATLPKYMLREFGEDVPKGTIYAINPALVIILVPIVTAATTEISPLTMIHYGTYISAGSVFCLVISNSVGACIAFVSILSIGEAIWSPRLYDYTMSVCEEGREGTYMALSSAPLFLAKLPVGFLSGYLLERYCPEEGERHSQTMWLIIGLLTASSPILLTVFWGYISQNDDSPDSPPNARYTELRSTSNTSSPPSYQGNPVPMPPQNGQATSTFA